MVYIAEQSNRIWVSKTSFVSKIPFWYVVVGAENCVGIAFMMSCKRGLACKSAIVEVRLKILSPRVGWLWLDMESGWLLVVHSSFHTFLMLTSVAFGLQDFDCSAAFFQNIALVVGIA